MKKWYGAYPGCVEIYEPRAGDVYIYALTDPQSGESKYIGQTVDLKRRYYEHCLYWTPDGRLTKDKWLHSLWRQSTGPGMRVLAIVPDYRSDDVERAYIEFALANEVGIVNNHLKWEG